MNIISEKKRLMGSPSTSCVDSSPGHNNLTFKLLVFPRFDLGFIVKFEFTLGEDTCINMWMFLERFMQNFKSTWGIHPYHRHDGMNVHYMGIRVLRTNLKQFLYVVLDDFQRFFQTLYLHS